MASRKSTNTYNSEIFYGGQKLHKYFCSTRIRGTSLLTCSYIGEVRSGRKFECENEVFILLVLRMLFT